MKTEQEQVEKFKKAARELECDDDEKAFKDRLAKIAKPHPKSENNQTG